MKPNTTLTDSTIGFFDSGFDSDQENDIDNHNTNHNTNNNNNMKNIVNEFANDQFTKICKNYDFVPVVNKAVKRIIVLGDIHGDYELAINMLKIAKVIDDNNNWIGSDTYVVQVGDQIDRCRPGPGESCNMDITYEDEASDIKILKLFTDLHHQAIKQGGKVISLLGNHELMNVDGDMSYVSKKGVEEFIDYSQHKIDKSKQNSDFDTGLTARKNAFKAGKEYGKFLGCTRLSAVIIGSNLFVHGGMINNIMKYLRIANRSDLENIDIMVRKWLLGLINREYIAHIVNSSNDSMFWNRILGKIPHNVSTDNVQCLSYIDDVLKTLQVGSIIVGHTPQSFLNNDGINSVCDNKIWRVDNGSSKAFHNFDITYQQTGKVNEHRKPQVLEILNDTEYRILK